MCQAQKGGQIHYENIQMYASFPNMRFHKTEPSIYTVNLYMHSNIYNCGLFRWAKSQIYTHNQVSCCIKGRTVKLLLDCEGYLHLGAGCNAPNVALHLEVWVISFLKRGTDWMFKMSMRKWACDRYWVIAHFEKCTTSHLVCIVIQKWCFIGKNTLSKVTLSKTGELLVSFMIITFADVLSVNNDTKQRAEPK